MARLIPKTNNPSADMIKTPLPLALACIQSLDLVPITNRCKILDPCSGDGAFFCQFPKWADSYWCELELGINFFDAGAQSYDYIISNPPWSKLREFTWRSMILSANVCFLAPLSSFITKARLRDIHSSGFCIKSIAVVNQYPSTWPQSGFQLVFIHIQRGDCLKNRTQWKEINWSE